MDSATLWFSLALVVISAALVMAHLLLRPRLWWLVAAKDAVEQGSPQPFRDTPHETIEANFQRRQFRRRMQVSLMIGVIGLVILSGEWFAGPWWRLAHLVTLLLLICWLMLLALVDLLATRHHYAQLRHKLFLEGIQQKATGQVPRGESNSVSSNTPRTHHGGPPEESDDRPR